MDSSIVSTNNGMAYGWKSNLKTIIKSKLG